MRITALIAGPLAVAGLVVGGATLAPAPAQDRDPAPEVQKKAGPREKGDRRPREKGDRHPRPEAPDRDGPRHPPDPRTAYEHEHELEHGNAPPEHAHEHGRKAPEPGEPLLAAREDATLARARLEAAGARMAVAEQRLELVRGQGDSGDDRRRHELEMREEQSRQMMEQARDRLTRLSKQIKRSDDPNLVRAREDMEARLQRFEQARNEREGTRASLEESGPGRRMAVSEAELVVAEARVSLVASEIELARAERRLARLEGEGGDGVGVDVDIDPADDDGHEVEVEIDLSGVPPAVSEALQILQRLLEDHEEETDEEEAEGDWVPEDAPRAGTTEEKSRVEH